MNLTNKHWELLINSDHLMYDHLCVTSLSSLVPIKTNFLFSSSRQRVHSGNKTTGSYLNIINSLNFHSSNSLFNGKIYDYTVTIWYSEGIYSDTSRNSQIWGHYKLICKYIVHSWTYLQLCDMCPHHGHLHSHLHDSNSHQEFLYDTSSPNHSKR